MSRFDTPRRVRIAVWTGAALAWGTTAMMAAQRSNETPSAEDGATVTAQPLSDRSVAPLPTLPDGGLVVLRFQPDSKTAPEVRTVYVQGSSPAPSGSASAPAPRSSGS